MPAITLSRPVQGQVVTVSAAVRGKAMMRLLKKTESSLAAISRMNGTPLTPEP